MLDITLLELRQMTFWIDLVQSPMVGEHLLRTDGADTLFCQAPNFGDRVRAISLVFLVHSVHHFEYRHVDNHVHGIWRRSRCLKRCRSPQFCGPSKYCISGDMGARKWTDNYPLRSWHFLGNSFISHLRLPKRSAKTIRSVITISFIKTRALPPNH